jgi:hypothetical protein
MNEMLDDEALKVVDEGVLVVVVVEGATVEVPVDETLERVFEDDGLTFELVAELEDVVAGVVDVVEEDVGVVVVVGAVTGALDEGVATGAEVAAGALNETWTVN